MPVQPPSTLFADFPRNVLDASGNVIYLLDSDLRIAYCNPAWDRFARANDGLSALAEAVIGVSVLDVVAEPLRGFYQRVFLDAKSDPLPLGFDYECSSANVQRLMRMEVHFMPSCGGFALINSLRLERVHSYDAHPADPSVYLDQSGFIGMCCHCRRTRRAKNRSVWDWVPHYVHRLPPNVTHGICPTCLAHFYPAVASRAASL